MSSRNMVVSVSSPLIVPLVASPPGKVVVVSNVATSVLDSDLDRPDLNVWEVERAISIERSVGLSERLSSNADGFYAHRRRMSGRRWQR